jgi:hypothetical protein
MAHNLNYRVKLKTEVMKTMKITIMNLFLISGLLMVSVNAISQEKLTRQERKEVRKAQLAANFSILDSLLNSREFVLEADFLRNNYGERIMVPQGLNFIKINGTNSIMQTGANAGLGYNGVGGVTAEGTIGNWKIFKDFKNLNYTIQFNVVTNIGNYYIVLNVDADNHASATISGLTPGQLTWDGHLETIGNSRIFKGQNSI